MIELSSENGLTAFKQTIDQDFSYKIDEKQNLMVWLVNNLKSDSNEDVAFSFKMITDNACVILQMVIFLSRCQFHEKIEFENIVLSQTKKYSQELVQSDDETEISEKLSNETKKSNLIVETKVRASDDLYLEESLIPERELPLDIDITGMAQGLSLNRAFINKGNIIETWKVDDSDETKRLEYILKLPELKKLKGEDLNPSKLFLQEGDTKMVMTEGNLVFYYDIENGKVIREISSCKYSPKTFEDICPYEKNQNYVKKEFFG